MAKITSLIKSVDQQTLNADQKKYFKLLEDIEKLSKDKEDRHEFYLGLLNKYHAHIEPIIKANALAYKEMAVMIAEGSNKVKVSNKTIELCEDLIPMLIEKYHEQFPEDETTKELYENWAEERSMYEEDEDEALDIFGKIFMRKKIKDNFGIDIDPDDFDIDLNDPESYKKFHEKYGEEIKNKQQAEQEKWDNRKKTKKEIANEAKEKADKRNIREIYIGLAKQLHPDKASNEAQRERNEAAMKLITEAYENNDIITLLNLEIKYLNYNETDLLSLGKDKIKSFINVLTDQKRKLTNQFEMVKTHPTFQEIYKYISDSAPNYSLKLFDQDFAAYKNNNAFLRSNLDKLKRIDNKSAYQKFVSFLHEQFEDEFEDESFFDFIDFIDAGIMDDDLMEGDDNGKGRKKGKRKKG
jgi:hypothetical protein